MPASLNSKPAQPPTVSPNWLLAAFVITLVGAASCAWGTLCLLFWQGSWQLLYHPRPVVARTPQDAGISYDPVGFAATETGELRINGWWIPATPAAPLSRFTILYLHGAAGNLGDTVSTLEHLHALGVNLLAFDYRGYGQSQFVHPSEARWLEDANWALTYLTQTRHTDPHTIVIVGNELGADLAVEVAAAHPELAGVVVESPIETPMLAVFDDPRAQIIPAYMLVKDRYDIDSAAAQLRVPSLWLEPSSTVPANPDEPTAYDLAAGQRQLTQWDSGQNSAPAAADAISHWIGALTAR